MSSEKLNVLLSQGFAEYWVPRSEEENHSSEAGQMSRAWLGNKKNGLMTVYPERSDTTVKTTSQNDW